MNKMLRERMKNKKGGGDGTGRLPRGSRGKKQRGGMLKMESGTVNGRVLTKEEINILFLI